MHAPHFKYFCLVPKHCKVIEQFPLSLLTFALLNMFSSSLLSKIISFSYNVISFVLWNVSSHIFMKPFIHKGQDWWSEKNRLEILKDCFSFSIVVRISSALIHCVSNLSHQFTFSTQVKQSCFGNGSVFLIYNESWYVIYRHSIPHMYRNILYIYARIIVCSKLQK